MNDAFRSKFKTDLSDIYEIFDGKAVDTSTFKNGFTLCYNYRTVGRSLNRRRSPLIRDFFVPLRKQRFLTQLFLQGLNMRSRVKDLKTRIPNFADKPLVPGCLIREISDHRVTGTAEKCFHSG